MQKGSITLGVVIALAVIAIGGSWLAHNMKGEVSEPLAITNETGGEELGTSPRIFTSSQVGSNPQADYILSTNGTVSTWIENTGGGGGGGGGSSLWDWENQGTNLLTPSSTATSFLARVQADSFNATSTATSSNFVNASTTNLTVSGVFHLLGDAISNVATWFQSYLANGYNAIFGTATTTDLAVDNTIKFDNVDSQPSYEEGLLYYQDSDYCLTFLNGEAEVRHQLGCEYLIPVYNDTGSTITDGSLVYSSGYDAGTGLVEVSLANASQPVTARITGSATHDIENGTVGYVTRIGTVNNVDTTGFTAGQQVWLATTTAGGFTANRPKDPYFAVPVGTVLTVNATTGSFNIGTVSDNGGIERVTSSVFAGSSVDDPRIVVTSDGTDITLAWDKTGGGDMTIVLDEQVQTVDTTPALTIKLGVGTDTSPVTSYAYYDLSEAGLATSSTAFPTDDQYVPIGVFFCQSASTVQTNGCLKEHQYSDHVSNDVGQGHISHNNFWIRQQPATWLSGTQLTPTGGASNLDVAVSSGLVLQLHPHSFPAIDTNSGGSVFVVNDPDASYTEVTELTLAGGVDKDANGTTLGDSTTDFYNLVFWGVANELASTSKLMMNLPNGAYANDNGSQASDDNANTAVYSIPQEYRGVGFLIARLTIQENGGTYTIVQNEDLRGQTPSLGSSTGGAIGNEFPDNVFRINDDLDATKQIAFQASGLTTATTRTLTVQDSDGTLAYTSDLHDAVTLAGTPDYITLAGQVITRNTIDIGDDTNLTCGTNCTLSGDEISVDDAFLVNNADDSTSGRLTVAGLTTSAPIYASSTIHAQADSSGLLARFFENSGGEYMNIFIEDDGDLAFVDDAGNYDFLISDIQGMVASPRYSGMTNTGVHDTNTYIGMSTSDHMDFNVGGFTFLDFTESTSDVATALGTWDFDGATVKQRVERTVTWPGIATTTSATTTIPLGTAYTAQAWNGAECYTTSGTSYIVFSDGTNEMNSRTVTTTPGRFALTTNNTFTQSETRYVEIGPLTNAIMSCTVDMTVNN